MRVRMNVGRLSVSVLLVLAAPGAVPYQALAAQVAAQSRAASVQMPSGLGAIGTGSFSPDAGATRYGASLTPLSGSLGALTSVLIPAPARQDDSRPAVTAVVSVPLVSPAVKPEALSAAVTEPPLQTHAAPLAASQLNEAKAVLSEAEVPGQASRESGSASLKRRWDRFWSRGSLSREEVPVVAAPMTAPPSSLNPARPASAQPASAVPSPENNPAGPKAGLGRIGRIVALIGAPLLALRLGLPAWLPGLWAKAAPYVAAGGFFLGAYAANHLVRRAVTAIGRRAHWQPSTVVAVRLVASIAIWAAGAALGLHALGIPTSALLATFGIGGVAMTMAAKEFIGNFMEGVKVLINHPFVIGDRIKVGANEYTVKDMNLRYVVMTRADGAVTMMTYTQISEKPVTISREYTSQRLSRARAARQSLIGDVARMVRASTKPGLLGSSLWTVLGVALIAALPFLGGIAPTKSIFTYVPYLQGAGVLLAAHSLVKGVTGFIARLAEKRGWNAQAAVILKLAVQLALYLAGGTVALRFFGMTWSALLTSLGATSIALGWASADVIGNLIQGFWILMNHPFTIGDELEVGGVSGTVVDMDISYVVLEHPGKSHTLVPYAVIKSSPFTVKPAVPSAGPAK